MYTPNVHYSFTCGINTVLYFSFSVNVSFLLKNIDKCNVLRLQCSDVLHFVGCISKLFQCIYVENFFAECAVHRLQCTVDVKYFLHSWPNISLSGHTGHIVLFLTRYMICAAPLTTKTPRLVSSCSKSVTQAVSWVPTKAAWLSVYASNSSGDSEPAGRGGFFKKSRFPSKGKEYVIRNHRKTGKASSM